MMPSEMELEVFRALRESQTRYTYFILAVTGAGIALAVQQTQGALISWSQAPLGLALLCWALSFLNGCRHLGYVSSTLYANGELLRVQSGRHPQVGQNPALMAAASEGIKEAIEENSDRANRLGHAQFRFLVAGAIFYVLWHVLEMYIRTFVNVPRLMGT